MIIKSILITTCWWPNKGTNLKANHNRLNLSKQTPVPVDDPTKVLIWKQITTRCSKHCSITPCWWPNKGTNLKANHNFAVWDFHFFYPVDDPTKVLIWKQITTYTMLYYPSGPCWWPNKGTNLKANHNLPLLPTQTRIPVDDPTKVLIWKQITTGSD